MSTSDPTPDPTATDVRLSPEDTARVHRLTEEVQGRLEELAALSCRALGLPLEPDMQRRFVRGEQATESESPYHHVEIVTTPTDPPKTVVVTYYDDGSVGVQYYD